MGREWGLGPGIALGTWVVGEFGEVEDVVVEEGGTRTVAAGIGLVADTASDLELDTGLDVVLDIAVAPLVQNSTHVLDNCLLAAVE